MLQGNLFINKSLPREIENGCIVRELPEVEFEDRMYSFSPPSLRLIVSSMKVH